MHNSSFFEDTKGMKKCLLFDLFSVGKEKPVGYLGHEVASRCNGRTCDEIVTELKQRGLEASVHEIYIVTYHAETLQSLLDEKKDMLAAEGWPDNAAGFARHVVTNIITQKANHPELMGLINRVFADPRFYSFERPRLGDNPEEMAANYWQGRRDNFVMIIPIKDYALFNLVDFIEIHASNTLARLKKWGDTKVPLYAETEDDTASKENIWRHIRTTADAANYTDEQISLMLRQLNKQLIGLNPQTADDIWQPVITPPLLTGSSLDMIGTLPSGRNRGAPNPTLPQTEN